jgi:uncharacterized protein (TIGR00251 family)
MRLKVKVIPGAKRNAWTEDAQGIKIHLNAPPVDGKANEALLRFLAEHFGVKISKIEIIKGLKSRHKVINIEEL